MRRLYWQIYLTTLAILLLFGVAISVLFWRGGPDAGGRAGLAMAQRLASELLPPSSAPRDHLRARVRELSEHLDLDLELYGADGAPIAGTGRVRPDPSSLRGGESRWLRGPGSRGAAVLRLPDGRSLVVRSHHRHGDPAGMLFGALALLGLAVAAGAYPVVRGLTRRIERLRQRVDALAGGDLSARVPIEGRDEVASLAASFNAAATRIEDLVLAQRRMLAGASHELRSPLARLRLAAELLGERAGAEGAELRERMNADIRELDSLVGEILTASRLEAGTATPQREDIDLLGLCAEEAAEFAAEVGGESVNVRADRRLLRRLVRNLLENARRHAATGIELAVERAGERAGIAVMDRGPGVPASLRDKLFEPFSGSGRGGGSGLGLALVRQIARLHGGDASFEDRPGGGSVFRVWLPIDPDDKRQASHASQARTGTPA